MVFGFPKKIHKRVDQPSNKLRYEVLVINGKTNKPKKAFYTNDLIEAIRKETYLEVRYPRSYIIRKDRKLGLVSKAKYTNYLKGEGT